MLEKLKVNSYTAAAFKQYKNNTEIAALLFDENGNRRSFAQFKTVAKPLMETFNKTHLQAEYDLAMRSAQSAAKWATYEKRGGKIKYVTVGDALVRDEHRQLNGTIKPVNDVFWNNHFPPNGWGCRCGTSWVADDTPDVEPQGYPNIPLPFQNNVGKTGQIFNPKHPYFADIDKATAKELTTFAAKQAGVKEMTSKRKQLIQEYEQNKELKLEYTGKKGGKVFTHVKADIEDYKDNIETAKKLADKGYVIQINQHFKKGHPQFGANAEYTVDGIRSDLKTPNSSVGNAFSKAQKRQKITEFVCNLKHLSNKAEIMNGINDGFHYQVTIERVLFVKGNVVKVITRQMWIRNAYEKIVSELLK